MAERPDIDVAEFREWTNGQMTAGTYGERKVGSLLDAYEELEAERDRWKWSASAAEAQLADTEARERKLREAAEAFMAACPKAVGTDTYGYTILAPGAWDRYADGFAKFRAALATPSTEGGEHG